MNRLDLRQHSLLPEFAQTVLTSLLRNNALIVLELPCTNTGVEHLIDLLECPILGFGNEEEDEDEGDEVRHEPDVSVLGSPVEIQGIDEVGSGESANPTKQETSTGTETEGIRTEASRRDLTGDEPSDGSNPSSVKEDVDTDKGNETLESGRGGRSDGVDDADDEHGETLDSDGRHQNRSSGQFSDDEGHHHDGKQTKARNDDGILERLSGTRHEEKVSAVDEEEHGAGRGLEANGGDGEESSAEIGTAEEIQESNILGQFLLDGPGFLDFLEFFGEEGLVVPTATEAAKGVEGGFGLAVRDKPTWGIWEEWRGDREEGGDDEKKGKRDLIAESAIHD